MKGVIWQGSSQAAVRAFPANARREAGFQLDKVQRGLDPDDWKPMPTVAPGAREIRISEDRGAFRVIYVADIGTFIYVLHAFQKKTQKTGKGDLELANKRYKLIGARP